MKLPHDLPTTAGRPFIDLAPDTAAAILRTIEAGWARASNFPDVNAGAGEVELNERLRDGMRAALDPGELPWGGTLIVQAGAESRSGPDILRPDGRTDIPILSIEIFVRYGEHDPHAIIECKRIAGDDARLCREYVVSGIDRFRTGKYAANHSTGFMAGYLIAGDANAAASGVNAYLGSGRPAGGPRPGETLRPSILVDESWAWTSRHPRAGTPEIDLHHALLPPQKERSTTGNYRQAITGNKLHGIHWHRLGVGRRLGQEGSQRERRSGARRDGQGRACRLDSRCRADRRLGEGESI